uniref:Uncharacterized protein n=1 Tax=Cacopsylla melanoneura TaxID=428564 RepID=A0A8D8T9T3_9HEMI
MHVRWNHGLRTPRHPAARRHSARNQGDPTVRHSLHVRWGHGLRLPRHPKARRHSGGHQGNPADRSGPRVRWSHGLLRHSRPTLGVGVFLPNRRPQRSSDDSAHADGGIPADSTDASKPGSTCYPGCTSSPPRK